jgi:aspartate racemase
MKEKFVPIFNREEKPRRIIGVLGGLGPETTAVFYQDLVKAATEKERPGVLIWSLPLDVAKEAEYISAGKHTKYYFQQLRTGAHRLITGGADLIVIPCNTVHEFHPALSELISVPVSNLIEIAAQEVVQRQWRKVLLLATSRTLQTRLYQTALEKSGVEIRVPEPEEQKKIDALIQRALADGGTEEDVAFLESLQTKAGADGVLLGCTDLQLMFPPSETVIDSMRELVLHTAKLILPM